MTDRLPPTGRRFKGTTFSTRRSRFPWGAQIRVDSRVFSLGFFETEEQAAEAFDNAAYWLHIAGRQLVALNFPETYRRESTPPPEERTQEVVQAWKEMQKAKQEARGEISSAAMAARVRSIVAGFKIALSRLTKEVCELECMCSQVLTEAGSAPTETPAQGDLSDSYAADPRQFVIQ